MREPGVATPVIQEYASGCNRRRKKITGEPRGRGTRVYLKKVNPLRGENGNECRITHYEKVTAAPLIIIPSSNSWKRVRDKGYL